ncbi:MAG: M56 family metallopeptidase [Bacteroidaceae bacterium]|nr:M56 family metallopeptidase [Bacteroidaceae bacterium]
MKWALTLTLLYSLYGLLLRRETFHALNRIVLLSVLVGSMLLLLCPFETTKRTALQEGVQWLETRVTEATEVEGETVMAEMHTTQDTSGEERWSIVRLVAWGYVIGLVVAWGMYLLAVGLVARVIRQGRRLELADVPKGVTVVVNERTRTPFSWMHWVVLKTAEMDRYNRAILAHELQHVRCRHSWDMLLCDFTARMLWWLPFAWMLRRDLSDIHEYQADRYVITHGYENDEYQLLLIKKAANAGLQSVVNGFNRSSIKKRLKMMYKRKSNRAAMLKVFYLLPLVAFAAAAFARPTLMEELQNTLRAEEERAPLLSSPLPASPTMGRNYDQPLLPPEEEGLLLNGEEAHGENTLPAPDDYGVDTCLWVPEPDPVAILDSTMEAVGARKIGEGVYVGAFRPNYTDDTIRVKHVRLDGGMHWEIDGHEDGYTIYLQQEDREELGHGYHIRMMQPARQATSPHVNNAPIDPCWRPADVTAQEADMQPFRLERGEEETRLNIYMSTEMPNPADGTLDMLGVDFAELALVDPKTGDRYMCRRVENYEDKFVALSIGDKAGVVVKITGIYPPIPEKVRRMELVIHTPDGWERTGTVFDLKKEGKPVRVIN